MAGGRPSKYEKLVKPRLFEISEWRRVGWTEEEIAKELGLSRRTLAQYKHLYPEFLRALKNETEELVKELRGALVRRAKGYQYIEIKKIYERNEDGQLVHTRTEETTRSQPADVAALNLALKNFDRENWSNDPQLLALKREELELKKKQIEKDDW
jgi:transcriptional regulator with XRE-family HTH domain